MRECDMEMNTSCSKQVDVEGDTKEDVKTSATGFVQVSSIFVLLSGESLVEHVLQVRELASNTNLHVAPDNWLQVLIMLTLSTLNLDHKK